MTVPQNSAQSYRADPRNENVFVYVNGDYVHRANAKVSVFDSGYVCGDGVWEGLRLVNNRVVSFDAHMDRLLGAARTISMDIGFTRPQIRQIVLDTFAKNGMSHDAYARLMITRGIKSTPNQDPRFIISGPTIVCVAEHKTISPEAKARGLRLFTSTVRCSAPDAFDLRLNSHSRLNLIQALIQALNAGADEALMLDPNGFVSSCNSTNFFIVRKNELWTSSGSYCFNGITRQTILTLARGAGISVHEKEFTLAETYDADEAFVTGTLGGVTPVSFIDGRPIGRGDLMPRLDNLYQSYLNNQ